MKTTHLRLVLDTNVLLAGLSSESNASQKIVDALQERKAIPLLSPPVLSEYRAVLLHPEIQKRFANLTSHRVAVVLARLEYIGEVYRDIRPHFSLPRDPRDAKFVELAIAGNATHIVTQDEDILSLHSESGGAGKRLRQRMPRLRIIRPEALMDTYGRSLEIHP